MCFYSIPKIYCQIYLSGCKRKKDMKQGEKRIPRQETYNKKWKLTGQSGLETKIPFVDTSPSEPKD